MTPLQDNEAEELTDKLASLKSREKTRMRTIKILETEIANIESELKKPVVTEDIDMVNEELVSVTRIASPFFIFNDDYRSN
jgi:uncharacterized protein YqeY